MNIAVIGTGGVGGFFGGKLCRDQARSGHHVSFVARGAHLAAIRDRGLCVKTAADGDWVCRPDQLTDEIEALPAPDLALVCVKSYDLAKVAARLARVVTSESIVIPLLNGVDTYERMRGAMQETRILPACVLVGTHIESPGVVAQSGGAGSILFGPPPQQAQAEPKRVTDLFKTASIKHEWFVDVMPAIWTKFVFIAGFGMVTAAHNRTLGEVMASPDLVRLVRSVMEEVASLAQAQGVTLPGDIVESRLALGGDFPPDTKTSFQRDVEQPDKPDERDLFAGTIIRMGRDLRIETPATCALLADVEARKPIASS
jgi:2-dehydropantoate 2-reductase